MSGVGSMVVLAAGGLVFDLPARLLPAADAPLASQLGGLAGSCWPMQRFNCPSICSAATCCHGGTAGDICRWGAFLLGLARGVAVHGGLLSAAGTVLLLAGRAAGGLGVVLGGGGPACWCCCGGRVAIATALAPLELTPSSPVLSDTPALPTLPSYMVESSDEGFTGAVVGVFQPRLQLLPMRWREILDPEAFTVAVRRRQLAIKTGGWWRGRVLAICFTLIGVGLAATLVGDDRLGTADGRRQFQPDLHPLVVPRPACLADTQPPWCRRRRPQPAGYRLRPGRPRADH